jgi:hypothetical protein
LKIRHRFGSHRTTPVILGVFRSLIEQINLKSISKANAKVFALQFNMIIQCENANSPYQIGKDYL